jgi:alkylated DNA repair dioxygenase AlkB
MNQYLIKQAILAHIDLPEGGEVITVLSLLSPATMVFRYRQTERMFSVPLPPRSLVQMRDEIRYNWTHEILPVESTRYSLVFRNSQECAAAK